MQRLSHRMTFSGASPSMAAFFFLFYAKGASIVATGRHILYGLCTGEKGIANMSTGSLSE
jgi:hypothetical protein